MSDSNMLTTYSWAAGLFQRELPSSLIDVEKRAKLLNEINAPLIQGNNRDSLTVNLMLTDLDSKEKDCRLDDIAQSSSTHLTEHIDN